MNLISLFYSIIYSTFHYLIYVMCVCVSVGFPGGTVAKNLLPMPEMWVWFLGWKNPLQQEMAIHSVVLPGESHEQKSLVGYSPCGCKESDMTEHAHTHTHTYLVFAYFPLLEC